MSPSAHDDAITPVIGTVIVLAITVMGIGTALYLGTPVLVGLRERAALENVVGQFEEVRAAANDMYVPDESRYPTISIPAGELVLGAGSHVLVTVDHDTAATCDLRVSDWTDWDQFVTIRNLGACTENVATCGSCLQVASVSGSTETPLDWLRDPDTVTFTLLADGTSTPVDLVEDSDYVFRLTNAAGTTTYAQAWLFHMDRLSWRTGGVAAAYEGGGIFAQEGEGYFLASSPLVSEDPPGGHYFLRMPTLQGSDYSALSGSGSHSVGLVLTSGHLRVDLVPATLLRLDFHGDLAEPWCNAFLLRDVLASLDGDYYTEDAAEPTHSCSGTADPDGIRSLKYDEPSTFRFTLTQTIIHGSLLL